MCCTCAASLLCQCTGSPADKSSVRWPYQSMSLLGLTNTTFINSIAGNSILILNTGHSFNSHPITSSGTHLHTFPFMLHSNQSLYFYYKPLPNPFLENLKDYSPCLCPEYVTTWSWWVQVCVPTLPSEESGIQQCSAQKNKKPSTTLGGRGGGPSCHRVPLRANGSKQLDDAGGSKLSTCCCGKVHEHWQKGKSIAFSFTPRGPRSHSTSWGALRSHATG